jgi:acyl-ACP thioesterase
MVNELSFTRCGADGKLKLHDAVAMMMDCCQFQEYQEAGLCAYLRENQIAVFLSSIQIDILRMPEFREKVTTAVKIYGCKSIYGLRRITMHDADGKLCLIANATGAFFDLNAKKAIKVDPEVFNVSFDEAEEMECLPRKIPVPTGVAGETVPAFVVKPSDLDPNGHLTSPVYLAIASNALKADFAYSRVRIEYKQQAKAGSFVLPVVYYDGDKAVVDMKSGDGISYAVAEFSTAVFQEYDQKQNEVER